MTDSKNNRAEELMDRLLTDGELGEDEAAELRKWLAGSEEARQRYLLRCELELAISDSAALGGIKGGANHRTKLPTSRSQWHGIIAVAAAVVIGLATLWFVVSRRDSKTVPNLVEETPEAVSDPDSVPVEPEPPVPPVPESQPAAHLVENADPKKEEPKVMPAHPEPSNEDQEGTAVVTNIEEPKTPKSDPVADEVLLGRVRRVSQEDADWKVGADVYSGEHEVKSARVEIDLNGVLVAIEGPARFSIIDGVHLRLISGHLAAEVTPAAEGFWVDANALEVIDLGTKFAVTANTKGDAAVHVYEGRVTAGLAGQASPLELVAGQTSRLNLKTGQMEPMPFRQDLFATPPNRTGDVVSHSDSVLVVEKPPREITPELSGKLLLFRERFAVTLARDVSVDIAAERKSGKVRKGSKVTSYLVHLSPLPDKLASRGAIRFDGRVLGIQTSGATLGRSDRRLGVKGVQPDAIYEAIARGLEVGEDPVEILEDGFTVQMSMRAVPPGTDQIRIIVEKD